jgi:hypothetical protein
MQEVDPLVPASVRYPLEDALDLMDGLTVGGRRPDYLTSTASFVVALAILKGYREIDGDGVEMDSNTEYTFQREGFLFWLGLAHGRGIRLTLHCMDGVFYSQPMYGYGGSLAKPPEEYRLRAEDLKRHFDDVLFSQTYAKMAADLYKDLGKYPVDISHQSKAKVKMKLTRDAQGNLIRDKFVSLEHGR